MAKHLEISLNQHRNFNGFTFYRISELNIQLECLCLCLTCRQIKNSTMHGEI